MDDHHKMSEDLERVIMKDDTSSSVTTEEEQQLQQYQFFRERLSNFLHSYRCQVAIVGLVIFDCLLVIGELLIDLRILELQEHNYEASEVLHYMGITILSIFVVEIIAKLYAFRLEFFRHKMEMFDAVVVIVSLALDLTFLDEHNALNGAELVIILRLWRTTRILNGIVMSVKTQAERKLQRQQQVREALEQELAKYREYCTAQELEIEALHALLRKHGISENENSGERPSVLVNQMDVVAEVNHINEKNDRIIS